MILITAKYGRRKTRARRDLSNSPQWLWLVAAMLLLLNLADGMLTLLWTAMGVAEEANVLWGDLVGSQPVLFMATKLVGVSIAVGFLWLVRTRGLARVGLIVSFIAYACVFTWHLVIASVVL